MIFHIEPKRSVKSLFPPEARSEAIQTSKMGFFCENSWRLEVVNNFCKKLRPELGFWIRLCFPRQILMI